MKKASTVLALILWCTPSFAQNLPTEQTSIVQPSTATSSGTTNNREAIPKSSASSRLNGNASKDILAAWRIKDQPVIFSPILGIGY